MGLDQTNKSQRNSEILGILQFLLKIHTRIQSKSKTPISVNQKRQKLEMGGKREQGIQ